MPTHALKLKPTHIRTEKMRLPRRRRKTSSDPLQGCAGFFLVREYQQRCVAKVSYIRNGASRAWAAHGDYLQREHAQTPGERGLGFDADHNDIDIKSLLRFWQKSDDPLFFKIILSPENGYQMDLHQHARDLMQQMQIDLNTKLEWAAIDHHNTDHPHVHIVVRGIDQHGNDLRMDPQYITHGIRERSQLLATRELGLQRNHDIIQQREQHIERNQMTEIDRSLRHRADDDGIVSFKTRVPDNALAREWRLQEIGRLKYLETLDLAKQIEPKVWELSDKFEATLRQIKLEDDIVDARARHGLHVTHQEEIAPTKIEEDSPLTGKVVAMGLENELYDKRYLIVEGTDGKAHYLQASANMVRQHDEGGYRNGDVVTISRDHFTNNDGEKISYLSVENHGTLDDLKLAMYSKLDDDTIDFVKTTSQVPQALYP